MTKQDIIEYVMHTPGNTNKAVLSSMLNQFDNVQENNNFSTATVTLTGNYPDNIYLPIIVQYPEGTADSFIQQMPDASEEFIEYARQMEEGIIMSALNLDEFTQEFGTNTVQAILYNGGVTLIAGFAQDITVISGSATVVLPTICYITGDCTISITKGN